MINITAIIPPMTKHARLKHNSSAKKHFSLISRADSYSLIKEQFGQNVENEASVNCCLATAVVNRNS